jgi:Gas vesicle synthesis protein GvpO
MNEASSNGRVSAAIAIRTARELLTEVVGKPVESVSGVGHSEDGWSIALDVVELSRIPPSTDLLATYQVALDQRGDLVDLVRTRRYMRNQADQE